MKIIRNENLYHFKGVKKKEIKEGKSYICMSVLNASYIYSGDEKARARSLR